MKKTVIFIVLLLCMSAAVFAEDYSSWDEICDEFGDYDEFQSNCEKYKEQYEAAVEKIIPFLQGIDSEVEIDLSFDFYSDRYSNEVLTPFIDYITDDIWFMFYFMHLESDGLHATVDVTNMNDDRVGDIYLTFPDFVLKSDGSFVSGTCSNYEEEDYLVCDDYDTVYLLYDAVLEETSEGYIVTCNDFELSRAEESKGVKAGKKGKAVIDWFGNILSKSQ